MASRYYPLFLAAMLQATSDSNVNTGTVKFAFLSSAYTYNASHEFLSSITGVIGTAVTMGGKGFTDGIWSASSMPDYTGGGTSTATQFVTYIDTGVAGTSRLISHHANAPSLPLTFASVDQPLVWTPQPLCDTAGATDAIWYPKFAEALWTRPSNSALSGTLQVVGIDTGAYTYASSHEFLSSVPGGARIGTPQTIGSKTYTAGVLGGANVTFPSFTGASIEALLVYLSTGSDATSRLVGLLQNVQGLPLTPNGSNQPINWNPTDGILRLGATL